MLAALNHRGPDANGIWRQDSVGLILGHARLAVMDISEAGAQPMISSTGQFVLTYNGEIYNHREIRERLSEDYGIQTWRGESDTETLLVLIGAVGVEAALAEVQGMFAFALWDRDAETLTVARDRMGEKPLYYGVIDGVAVFCSELHAIRANKEITTVINRTAVSAFGAYGFVPAPLSIYESISKLPAGGFGCYSMATREWKIQRYWHTTSIASEGLENTLSGTDAECMQRIEKTLQRVVEQEMISDVPFGAFLSGGIDSSLIVSQMQKISETPVSTFTIGFSEPGYNEAQHAKEVASYLRTNHTELYIDNSDLLDIVPGMGSLYDEPFSDESAIPTHIVSRLARNDVTVALSGDGGDELFCGYNRHHFAASSWGRINRVPNPIRRVVSGALSLGVPFVGAMSRSGMIGSSAFASGDTSAKMRKLAGAIASNNVSELYDTLLCGAVDRELWGSVYQDAPITGESAVSGFSDVELVMLYDQLLYLPDNILVKVDRAAMGCSLETRAPFLHPDMVSLAWQLPHTIKFRNGVSKWGLREILYRNVPRELVDRPKSGFEVPIASWLKGPLREWVEALCSESAVDEHGLLSSRACGRLLDDYFVKGKDRSRELWRLVCFQSWYKKNSAHS